MKKTLVYKIFEKNLITGELKSGSEIKIKVNQTLTQDSTGTMVYLQLLAMNVAKVKTDLSVAYIDHNMLQASFENADDHEFIKSVALKHNVIYSKPGNGICHRLHLENFAKPGDIIIGSDSHTPTAGGISSLAIGAGGLDVAIGMADGTYTLIMPKIFNIKLINKLKPWVSAKDIILHILKQLSVKGGVGYIIEYTGAGLQYLSVEDRATITNMGAELGATTSIFESDNQTKDFLIREGRVHDYIELKADENAIYDKEMIIDLANITPQVAFPHSPDNVKDVTSSQIKINQVCVGSCTNSSYKDLMLLAQILKNKKVHPDVSLTISVGSANILEMLSNNGALSTIIAAGARILESSCGPCIGMGQAPQSNGVSLRTFNRNFKGRSGTLDADVYLVSVETAAISAINGYLSTNFETNNKYEEIELPSKFIRNLNYFIFPDKLQTNRDKIQIIKGPNIKDIPIGNKLTDQINQKVILKVEDNITTDDICPSSASLLPYRSNIPYLSNYCFKTIIDDFAQRANNNNGGIIIAKNNYGQGSSREHAAMLPQYLNIKYIIAYSFARIHRANLINNGIIPFIFNNETDYESVFEYDTLIIKSLSSLKEGNNTIEVLNETNNNKFKVDVKLTKRELEIINYGGYLNYIKAKGDNSHE